MEKRKREPSLVGPVILIGLGILFLLNNLGILPWSVWEMIFRLWPVLIIAAGLEILIGRRSVLGSLVVLVLTLALVVGLLRLFGAGIVGPAADTEEIVQALNGATQAEVVIAPAVGALHVGSLPEPDNLVEGVIHLGSGERLVRDFEVQGEMATFALRSEGNFVPFVGSWGDEWVWDLGLSPDVPLELEISLGAGQSDVDLTGLAVSDLKVSMGVGQTTVVLPDEGNFVPFVGSWGDEWVWDLGLSPDVPLELEISLGAGQSDVDLTGLAVSDLKVSMGVGQTTVVLPDEGDFRAEIEGAA